MALLLDDMGAGHTSISYLDRYPVFACFKIDRLHISALPGPRPQAIVAAIVGVGRAYDVTVVGEGVETADQLAALRAAGCDLAQGNYLAHPMDHDSVTALLRTDTPTPGGEPASCCTMTATTTAAVSRSQRDHGQATQA